MYERVCMCVWGGTVLNKKRLNIKNKCNEILSLKRKAKKLFLAHLGKYEWSPPHDTDAMVMQRMFLFLEYLKVINIKVAITYYLKY